MTNLEIEVAMTVLRECLDDALMEAVLNEQRIRQQFGRAEAQVVAAKGKLARRVVTSTTETPGRDLYGHEKSTEVRYFECSACERSIAGNRFAAHVARCGGRRR